MTFPESRLDLLQLTGSLQRVGFTRAIRERSGCNQFDSALADDNSFSGAVILLVDIKRLLPASGLFISFLQPLFFAWCFFANTYASNVNSLLTYRGKEVSQPSDDEAAQEAGLYRTLAAGVPGASAHAAQRVLQGTVESPASTGVVFPKLSDQWLLLAERYRKLMPACRCFGVMGEIPRGFSITVDKLFNDPHCPLHIWAEKPVIFHATEQSSLQGLMEEIKPLGDGPQGQGFYTALNPLYCISFIMSKVIIKISPVKTLNPEAVIRKVNEWIFGKVSREEIARDYRITPECFRDISENDNPKLLVLGIEHPGLLRVRKAIWGADDFMGYASRGALASDEDIIQMDSPPRSGDPGQYPLARYLFKAKAFEKIQPLSILGVISLHMFDR